MASSVKIFQLYTDVSLLCLDSCQIDLNWFAFEEMVVLQAVLQGILSWLPCGRALYRTAPSAWCEWLLCVTSQGSARGTLSLLGEWAQLDHLKAH